MVEFGSSKFNARIKRGERVPKSTKKFEELAETKPPQMRLFQFIEDSEEQLSYSDQAKYRKYSQSIELYDFMPKYFWGKAKRDENGTLPILVREFSCRDIKRKLRVHPAGIVVNETTNEAKYFYLGRREEVVEEVLRKLAIESGAFYDGQSGVSFTIGQIRRELALHHHSYSYYEVIEALNILALTKIELINPGEKKASVIFSPIETLGLSGDGDETQSYVVFSTLVTEAIKGLQFRLYNYEQVMSYRTVVARLLHKRMAHHYKQASIINKYRIYLSTIIRDFGLTPQKSLGDNLREVEKSLQEMIDKYVLLNYAATDKVIDPKTNKLIDVMLELQPSIYFETDAKKANFLQGKNEKMLHGSEGLRKG